MVRKPPSLPQSLIIDVIDISVSYRDIVTRDVKIKISKIKTWLVLVPCCTIETLHFPRRHIKAGSKLQQAHALFTHKSFLLQHIFVQNRRNAKISSPVAVLTPVCDWRTVAAEGTLFPLRHKHWIIGIAMNTKNAHSYSEMNLQHTMVQRCWWVETISILLLHGRWKQSLCANCCLVLQKAGFRLIEWRD